MAESSAVSMLLPALFGLTERRVDNEYSKILAIDPRVTVSLVGKESMCTGTFISDTHLLTAVHCIDATSETGNVSVDGIESVHAYFNKGFNKEHLQLDVALVVFPEGTGKFLRIKKYPRLATKAAGKGDVIYLVGFGMENAHDFMLEKGRAGAGIKGWGTADVEVAAKGIYISKEVNILNPDFKRSKKKAEVVKAEEKKEESKNRSRALPGDSGGAIYNVRGEIVGVASAVMAGENLDEDAPALFKYLGLAAVDSWDMINVFADVTSQDSETLLTDALNCEDVRLCLLEGSPSVGVELSFALEAPADPFAHVTLLTGYYKGGTETAFVRPAYSHHELIGLDLAITDGTSHPKIEEFVCITRAMCANADSNALLMVDGKKFTLHRMEPNPADPEKFIEKEKKEFVLEN